MFSFGRTEQKTHNIRSREIYLSQEKAGNPPDGGQRCGACKHLTVTAAQAVNECTPHLRRIVYRAHRYAVDRGEYLH